MFSIFKKSAPIQTDLSSFYLDMHSHLIPGVDDGAPDVASAVALVKNLQDLGIQKVITTPHVMADLYPNTSEGLQDGLQQLKEGLKAENIEIEVEVAAEYLIDEAFGEKIEQEALLTLPGNRVLVEMSFVAEAPNLHNYLFQLQAKGYRPIMAHPERYLYYRGNLKEYERLKDYGCEFQLNLLSCTDYYGKAVKDIAKKLLKAELYDFIGTDLHRQEHLDYLNTHWKDRFLQQVLDTEFKNKKLK